MNFGPGDPRSLKAQRATMGNEASPNSALNHFAKEVEEARRIAKGPDLFWRQGTQEPDQICILQRWNSHTPSLLDVWGGGYFLRWRGRGTIIDPGCSFIRLFRLHTPYGLQDVNMVLATHDHVDHCQDLGTLISLLRGYNKWLNERGMAPRRIWDIIMSLGVADQFVSLLVNPENVPYLRWRRVLPPRDIEVISEVPGRSPPNNPKIIAKKYFYKLRVLQTFHKELLGGYTGLGLRFTLSTPHGGEKTIVISGDTGVNYSSESSDGQELVESFQGGHLLILHVGTMEKPNQTRVDEHLGIKGVVEILQKLAGDPPEVVVLTEWGYEFGRLGLLGRSRFTELAIEELERKGCNRYFAAIEGKSPRVGQVPVIPGDLNLRISLPNLQVWSESRKEFVPATQIWAIERAEEILFV